MRPRSRSSPATRTPRRRSRRSTGRRWRRSRARSSSTWASSNLPRIAERLIDGRARRRRAGGRDRARHAARPAHGRRHARDACRRRRRGGVEAPAILLFGPVAARRSGSPGSSGVRCTAARSSSRAPARSRARSPPRLRGLGAEVVELPAIRIEPRIDSPEVAAMVENLHSYALVCLTSPNGVDLLLEAMAEPRPRRPGARRTRPSPRSGREPHGRCARTG